VQSSGEGEKEYCGGEQQQVGDGRAARSLASAGYGGAGMETRKLRLARATAAVPSGLLGRLCGCVC
jgi:hypothetical protein